MKTGDYHLPSLGLRVPKRRRTERRRPSPTSDYSGLTEDEKVCILALLALSMVSVIDDEKMIAEEEERDSLLWPDKVEQSQSVPFPSSSPPKQQREEPPISPPSLSQQDQQLPLPPPAERDLSRLPPQQHQTLPLPPPAERDLSPPPLQQNQPLPIPPPAERTLSPLPPQQNQPLPPPPEQALPLVLCPMPILCYRPTLLPPAQRPTPSVSLALTQQNQSRYECSECGKAFPSYQALGGHKTKHRKRPAENSAAAYAESVVAGAKDQNELHKCSLCPKSFPTGQALGGHMRAHYEGNKRQATADGRPAARLYRRR